MHCTYPLCRSTALWIPVVALPTIRTAGNGADAQIIKSERPTYLMFKEVCDQHKESYAIEHCGLTESDWAYIGEAARSNGYILEEPSITMFEFKPIGWTPSRGYLELERGLDECRN